MPTKDLHNMWEETFNYFKRLVSDKMEKRDLLISLILFGSVFVFSWWLGGPVGGFSFVLAAATIWNVKVTRGLLSRSEEAFGQSRIVFLANIVKDLVDYAEEQKNLNVSPVEYIKRTLLTFGKIDKEMAKEVWEIMETWARGTTYKVSMKNGKDSFMKNLDNL